MLLELQTKGSQEISKGDRKEIDEFIEYAIDMHKSNSSQINKLVIDSVSALTVSEARSSELADQGFFKRLWNGVTGKNQKIRADIDRNLAKSQYASQQMIQKLAEQNLLTFDTITAVNNKLNTLMLDVDEEINKIYNTLVVFFKQTRSDLIQMESRIDKLEKNVDLLHWNSTIEYQMYDGIEYCELPNMEKIVCVVNDFFHLSKANWTTPDLMLLKSTLAEIGLPVKSKLPSNEFYEYMIDQPKLLGRLFKDIQMDGLVNVEEFQAPLLKGVEKLSKLQSDEKYVVDTVVDQLELSSVDYNKRDIQISMIHHYLLNTAYMRTDVKVNMFDFVVELLSNLKMIDANENVQELEEIEEVVEEVEVVEEIALFDESKKNERGNSTGNIMNKGFIASQGDWYFYRNSGDHNKLYRVLNDNTEKMKLCNDEPLYINVIGEWIYYSNLNNGNVVYKIKLDGTERTKLNNDNSKEITVIDDWIYYVNVDDDSNIYRMNIDGDTVEKLTEKGSFCYLNVVNNWIYFNEDRYSSEIYKMKADGSNKEEIHTYKPAEEYLIVDRGNCYYKNGLSIFRENPYDYMGEVFVKFMTVGNGEVFYFNHNDELTRIKNGKEVSLEYGKELDMDFTNNVNMNLIDDWLYFEHEGKTYRVNKDGGERQVVD